MELEYGRPVEEIFVDITPEPLAAASLGQVGEFVVLSDGLYKLSTLHIAGRGWGRYKVQRTKFKIDKSWNRLSRFQGRNLVFSVCFFREFFV